MKRDVKEKEREREGKVEEVSTAASRTIFHNTSLITLLSSFIPSSPRRRTISNALFFFFSFFFFFFLSAE